MYFHHVKIQRHLLKVIDVFPFLPLKLAPYTASWAKRHLTEILEQQFLCLDVGEEPEEASITEDSEPVPTTSDPWLQGCVPIVISDPPHHVTAEQVC